MPFSDRAMLKWNAKSSFILWLPHKLTDFFAHVRAIMKRPWAWALSVIAAAATAYFTTVFTDASKTVSAVVSDQFCRFRNSQTTDDSRFVILVSPLAGDTTGSQTARLIDSFRGERAFRVVPICDALTFDNSKDI